MGTKKLIKQKAETQSEVWELGDVFRKKWLYKDEEWLTEHYQMLTGLCSVGYLKGIGFGDGEMWLDTYKIQGKLANTFEYTPEFIEKIFNFCLEHYYTKTKPYAHFDWDLSNMIINGDDISLVDWDNCRIYPEGQVFDKMESDLKKPFVGSDLEFIANNRLKELGENYNIKPNQWITNT